MGPLNPFAMDPRDAVSFLDQAVYMRQQLLRDSDAMSMAHSIELRVPFLDSTFSRFAWRLGPEARDGKRMFSRACADLLPEDILTRPKRGFTFPFAEWMTDALRPEIEEALDALPPDVFRPRTGIVPEPSSVLSGV